MSYLLNCSFSRVLHYLMFEVGGQNWIKLARIYWCEVLTKFWMNLIGNFQVEPKINSCWCSLSDISVFYYDYLLWWNSKNQKEWNEPKEFSQLQEGDQSSWIEKWKVCKILLQPLKMARNDKSEKSHGLAIARLLICAQEDFWIIPQEIRKTCLAKPSPSPKSTQNRVLWEPERLITLQKKTGKK